MWRSRSLRVPRAAGDGALDIGLAADRQHDGADQAHDARHLGNDDGHDHDAEAGPREGDQRDGKQDRGDRHQAVHDAHDQAVDAAEVAAGDAERQAEQAGDRRHREAHDQRDARAVHGARKYVAAELVGAEPPALRWRAQAADRRELERIAGDIGRENADGDQQCSSTVPKAMVGLRRIAVSSENRGRRRTRSSVITVMVSTGCADRGRHRRCR